MTTGVSGADQPRQRTRDFWLFWLGETISNVGGAFTLFALPLLVFKLTGSALNLGLASTAEMLPYLCFGLLIGAWVDRLDRKRLMILIDLGQALVIASIPVLFLLSHLTVWWIYAVSFVSTTMKIGFEAGQFAAIPRLVEQADFDTANGQLQASFSAAQMLGPVLAGALLFLLPLPTLLFINAGSFLVSACTLSLIRRSFNAKAPRETTSVRQDIAEGLRYVLHQPVLRAITSMTPLLNFLTISLTAQLALFATSLYHAAGWQISLFYAAASAGFALFAVLAGPIRKRWSFSRVALGAFMAYGLLTVTLAFTPWYPLALVLWGLIQGCEMLFNVVARSLRMTIVPNHLLGRVLSVAYCLGWSSMPLGALLGGALIKATGQVALVYAGIGGVVFLISFAFSFTALGHAERSLPEAALPAQMGASAAPAEICCPTCQTSLPGWANFCGACGVRQRPALVGSDGRHAAGTRGAREVKRKEARMREVELLEGLRPLPLAEEARWSVPPHRRLKLVGAEEAVVQALVQQRERYCQTRGRVPLCLSLPQLAAHLGLPNEKPKNLQRIISRVSFKLAAHGWTIAWLQSSLGARGYALFSTSEVLLIP